MLLFFILDLHFVVVLHLSMFFIFVVASSFTFSFRRHSSSPFCGLSSGFLHPILYFQPSPSIAEWFASLSFFDHSLSSWRKLPPWVGIFYPQVFFTLFMLLHQHFNVCLSRLSWEPAVLPSSVYKAFFFYCFPAYLFFWFIVIHRLYTQNDSVLNSAIY